MLFSRCARLNKAAVMLTGVFTLPACTLRLRMRSHFEKKIVFVFAVSPFPRKAVGFNFPPIFGMTLTGPVGIEAPVSHHAAGG